eukprot:3926415-Lingulodinium_polyedra.AAC.1
MALDGLGDAENEANEQSDDWQAPDGLDLWYVREADAAVEPPWPSPGDAAPEALDVQAPAAR